MQSKVEWSNGDLVEKYINSSDQNGMLPNYDILIDMWLKFRCIIYLLFNWIRRLNWLKARTRCNKDTNKNNIYVYLVIIWCLKNYKIIR